MQEGEGAEAGEGVAGRGASVVRELRAEHSCTVPSECLRPSSRPAAWPKMKPAVVLLLLLLAEQAGEVC